MNHLTRRMILGATALLVARSASAEASTMEVWKASGCGCCEAWANPFRTAGWTVTVHEVDDTAPVRAGAGVPEDLASCHTAIVGGYALEGHVPLADVQRLLVERPAIRGLAVPGMPVGSQGMEMPGTPPDAFRVIAFAGDSSRYVFREVL